MTAPPASGLRQSGPFWRRWTAVCETPIAGLAELDGGTLRLRGEILRTDGSEALADAATAPIEDGPEMARELARGLLERAGEGFFDWR